MWDVSFQGQRERNESTNIHKFSQDRANLGKLPANKHNTRYVYVCISEEEKKNTHNEQRLQYTKDTKNRKSVDGWVNLQGFRKHDDLRLEQ